MLLNFATFPPSKLEDMVWALVSCLTGYRAVCTTRVHPYCHRGDVLQRGNVCSRRTLNWKHDLHCDSIYTVQHCDETPAHCKARHCLNAKHSVPVSGSICRSVLVAIGMRRAAWLDTRPAPNDSPTSISHEWRLLLSCIRSFLGERISC